MLTEEFLNQLASVLAIKKFFNEDCLDSVNMKSHRAWGYRCGFIWPFNYLKCRYQGLRWSSQKLKLFISSQSFDLDGIPISDCPTLYAFFSVFQYIVFSLSPCKLENFEKALRCNPSNSPSDSVHVSPLPTLRKHLEFLYDEGPQFASNCLRCLNRGLPNLVTQSVFTNKYLLMCGSGLKPSFKTVAMKMASKDKEIMVVNKLSCCRNQ